MEPPMSESVSPQVAVVVGNPKPRSRTFAAAQLVAERLAGAPAQLTIDLADFGSALLDWSDPAVAESVAAIQRVDLVVVASPTYKGSYTGVLKLFLDRIGGGALAGVSAVPLMLGGDWRHSLAPEVFLKPVLAELGLSCPTRGLFLLDSDYEESEVLESWLEIARRQLHAAGLPGGAAVGA
jgi:FMN reductase